MAAKTTSKSSAKVTTGSATGAPDVIEVVEVNSTTYRVIETFKDTDGHIYIKGENYPAEGAKVADDRVHALLTNENRMNRPFIDEEMEG